VDGNKRVAAAATEAFIVANGGSLAATDDELFDLFISIAASRMSRDEVEAWFRGHVHMERDPETPSP
jgi:prophage maintenance system killer protein